MDHSKTALTLSKDFYDLFTQTIVIDHHRRDQDFPENAVITYIESGASSASELVTELIQFQNSKKNRLSRMQASVLTVSYTHLFLVLQVLKECLV